MDAVRTDPGTAAALQRPVPAASAAVFRIGFGLIVAWEAWRYLDPSHRWVDRYYVDPQFFFGYWPFEWVTPLPAPWIHLVFVLMGVAGLSMAAGLFYRVAAPTVFVALTYIFLLDKTRYLNHWYLMILLAALLLVLPVHRYWSFDARRRPELASSTIPAWALYVLRFQVAVPYLLGGIAKLNQDWLAGRPLYDWISDESDFPLIGGLLDERWFVLLLAYAALALDLLVVPMLFTRWGRPVAFGAVVAFHLMNDRFFSIGIFPWMMILATTLFLAPDWPLRLWETLRRSASLHSAAFVAGTWLGGVVGARFPGRFMAIPTVVTALAVGLVAYLVVEAISPSAPAYGGRRVETGPALDRLRPWLAVALGVWVVLQVAIPLRHFFIPGDVHWTEEGHRYAWHMKLRDKDVDAEFLVTTEAGQTFPIDTDDWLSSRQARKMIARPDMIVQFAHIVEQDFMAAGHGDVAVTADVLVSLNQGEVGPMIDPAVDLTSVHYPWWPPANWILPRP